MFYFIRFFKKYFSVVISIVFNGMYLFFFFIVLLITFFAFLYFCASNFLLFSLRSYKTFFELYLFIFSSFIFLVNHVFFVFFSTYPKTSFLVLSIICSTYSHASFKLTIPRMSHNFSVIFSCQHCMLLFSKYSRWFCLFYIPFFLLHPVDILKVTFIFTSNWYDMALLPRMLLMTFIHDFIRDFTKTWSIWFLTNPHGKIHMCLCILYIVRKVRVNYNHIFSYSKRN